MFTAHSEVSEPAPREAPAGSSVRIECRPRAPESARAETAAAAHDPTRWRPACQRGTELLRRTAGGDHAAFATFYRETSARLTAYVRSRVGNEEDVKEIVNDVYTSVWRLAHKYDEHQLDPVSWAVMIARSRVVDRARREATLVDTLGALQSEQASSEPVAENPADVTEREAEREMLQGAADMLTPRSRRVVRLAMVEGRTHPEIAAATREPLGTVKTRIRRALIAMRSRLLQHLGMAR